MIQRMLGIGLRRVGFTVCNHLTIKSMIVVFLTNKFCVIHHIQFLPSQELLATHEAGEALQMKHSVSSLANQVLRTDSQTTATALGSKPPETESNINLKSRNVCLRFVCFARLVRFMIDRVNTEVNILMSSVTGCKIRRKGSQVVGPVIQEKESG